jgi:hypothetical protein
MVIRHREDAFRLLSLTVALGRGTTFCIFDIMNEDDWMRTVRTGGGPLVVGGAVSGALEGLRRRGVSPADVLSCPVVSPGALVTEEDMFAAAGWLATGLLQGPDLASEQDRVTSALQDAGWALDPERVTSLVVAIAVTAGHAEDNGRG